MTDGVLVLNTLLFLANWASKDVLMLWGAKVNSLIAAGQLWRLVTCNFLHTNAIHFLVSGEEGRGLRWCSCTAPLQLGGLAHLHVSHAAGPSWPASATAAWASCMPPH
jgi:hypothetical protein